MNQNNAVKALLIATAWIGAIFAVSPLLGRPPLSMLAQTIIYSSPGWLATTAIEVAGSLAQPLLVLSLYSGVFLLLVGISIIRLSHMARTFHATLIASVCVYLGTLALFSLVTSLLVAALTALPVTIVTEGLFWYLTSSSRDPSMQRQGSPLVLGLNLSRRTLISILGVIATILVHYPMRLITGQQRSEATSSEFDQLEETTGATPAEDVDSSEFDFGSMPQRITPTEDHYVVDIAVENPIADPESWSLPITGAVEQPYELSYEELTNHEQATIREITLLCISNEVGGPLISTARWHGVPLQELITAANLKENARDIVTYGADGYSEAIPLETVQQNDVFVAFGMNGAELPHEHGSLARLLVPGRYGMKSTKWLTKIEIASQEHDAYWESRGWVEEGVINTASYVRTAEREGETVHIGGVAFAGLRGIEKVEVSVDGGETWSEATLEPPLSKYTWQRWKYSLDRPEEGILKVTVRATDGDGNLQTEERSDPHPGGSTGWHQSTFRV